MTALRFQTGGTKAVNSCDSTNHSSPKPTNSMWDYHLFFINSICALYHRILLKSKNSIGERNRTFYRSWGKKNQNNNNNKSETELTFNVLKKDPKHLKVKRTLFNRTEQDKTC